MGHPDTTKAYATKGNQAAIKTPAYTLDQCAETYTLIQSSSLLHTFTLRSVAHQRICFLPIFLYFFRSRSVHRNTGQNIMEKVNARFQCLNQKNVVKEVCVKARMRLVLIIPKVTRCLSLRNLRRLNLEKVLSRQILLSLFVTR